MKKFVGMVLLVLTMVLVGCSEDAPTNGTNGDDTENPTSTEFWNNTTIEAFSLDATFVSEDAAVDFADTYPSQAMTFYSVDDFTELSGTLDQLEALSVDISTLPESDDCEKEHCQYIVVPLFSTWLFDDYNLDSAYGEGTITFTLSVVPSNFPQTMAEVFVLRIDSDYPYDVVINPEED